MFRYRLISLIQTIRSGGKKSELAMDFYRRMHSTESKTNMLEQSQSRNRLIVCSFGNGESIGGGSFWARLEGENIYALAMTIVCDSSDRLLCMFRVNCFSGLFSARARLGSVCVLRRSPIFSPFEMSSVQTELYVLGDLETRKPLSYIINPF